MDEARWRRIDELFAAALDLPAADRGALLDRECGDDAALRRAVERLLAVEAEITDGDLLASSRVGGAVDDLAGSRVGPYRLLRVLGHGGMGTVYLAQRENDYRQEVAVKLVHPGLLSDEARRRLRLEGQALARLEHPNVARLYDGGTTDSGVPYLVMERVDGLPIDRYCDHHRLGLRRRVLLVRDLLAALSHAHLHLRVHCDVKPGNVLVTADGTLKLLDFGIAKLLVPEELGEPALTSTGLRPLTLAYASPEQVVGEPITTASDLYSVGALLYELLCGCPPHDLDDERAVDRGRAIVERDPPPPSRRLTAHPQAGELAAARGKEPRELVRRLRGDLDAIVGKAIRKQPGRRYVSAEAFAADLDRYLEARPVAARRGTWRYRAGRWLHRSLAPPDPRRRRERWAWAALLVLVAGLSAFALAPGRVPAPCRQPEAPLAGVWDEARRAAVEEAFLATGLPFAAGSFGRVSAALDRRAAAWAATEHEICAATHLRGERSERLLDLGRLCLDARREEMRALVDLFADADEGLVIDAVAAVHQLGELTDCTDDAELATRRLPPADPAVRRRLARLRSLIETQDLRRRLDQPVDLAALEAAEAELASLGDPALLARLLYVSGFAESYEAGDPEQGVADLEAALRAAIAAGDRPQQTRVYAALVKVLSRQQGDFERARFWAGLADASLASLSPGYGDAEYAVHEALGILDWESGGSGQARDHYRRALAVAERSGDPFLQISALSQLGIFDHLAVRRAIEIVERELGPDHVRLAKPLMNAAAIEASEGRYEEALTMVRRSYELRRATFGDDDPDLGYPLTLSGQILISLDRPAEAVEPLRRALALLAPSRGPRATIVRDVHVALAEALLLSGRPAAAHDEIVTAAAALPDSAEPEKPSHRYLLRVAGDVLRESGDLDAALARHRRLLAWIERHADDEPEDLASHRWSVARTLLAAGRADEARPLLEAALRGVRDADRRLAAGVRSDLAALIADDDPLRARRLAAEARRLLSPGALHHELLGEGSEEQQPLLDELAG